MDCGDAVISLDVLGSDQYLFAFRIYGHFGPKLTFKSLTNNTTFVDNALKIENWKYSLGDLELF